MSRQGYSTYELRLRAVKAVAHGVPVGKAAQTHGADRTTLFRWIKRHEKGGEGGLRRRPGSGRPRKLPQWERRKLWRLILQSAARFEDETGLWTVSRIHRLIRKHSDGAISRDTVWRRLREAGLAAEKPARPRPEANEEASETRRRAMLQIRRTARKYRAIVYRHSEKSVTLKAFEGGKRASSTKSSNAQNGAQTDGVRAIAVIGGHGRLLFALYQKRIASDEIIRFFDQLLRHHPHRHLVIALGQAALPLTVKTANYIQSQPRLHVIALP